MRRIILTVAATLFLAPVAGAAPGVLEINQACAVHTGCFSGDDPGFPVLIATSGSYLLTGNLVLPDVEATGIEVAAPSVSIDLGGFEIVTQACLGATSDCSMSGSGYGVYAPSVDDRGISVKNGGVTGMGDRGVFLGHQAQVTNLRARWNGGDGIVALFNAKISGNMAYENNGWGIYGSFGSTISGNTAYQNGSDGIYGSQSSIVSGNTVRGNTGFGLGLAASAGYAGNVISNNAAGTVNGSGVEIGPNLCNGYTACP